MKPPVVLTLILSVSFCAITAEAQTLADAARKERARQAQLRAGGAAVYTDANSHSVDPARPPVTATAPAAAPAMKTPTSATAIPAAPVASAVPSTKESNEEKIQKLRKQIRALEDQETAQKLKINDITNQVYSPVTDSTSHNDALAALGAAQAKLADVQNELAQTRTDLQKMEDEAQAAPKK